jgi:mannose-1-phosphate guanylyltransferase/mannose-6-phosphate isomerase
MSVARRVVAMLLSGGAGTRLWPLSTETMPKQFLRLFGDESLFQLTLGRLSSAGIDHVMVVTNATQATLVEKQAVESGVVVDEIVIEPLRRDSAPAIAAGVAAIKATYGPETVVVVLPCDHLIPDVELFSVTLRDGISLADMGFIGTFGIRPTHASTEFGYIQRAERVMGHGSAHYVEAFHEKPKRDVAETYLADGRYDWNSGMFMFQAGVFAEEARALMPVVWVAASEAVRLSHESVGRRILDAESFAGAPRISIDFALMERSRRVSVIPASFAWSDVGNWAAVHDAHDKDAHANAVIGVARLKDARGNLVVSEGNARVVLVGVEDLVVITCPTGTFIAPKSRASEVKAMISDVA